MRCRTPACRFVLRVSPRSRTHGSLRSDRFADLVYRPRCRRLNSLAVSQEEHIVESYGDKSTTELKRLLESLIGSAN